MTYFIILRYIKSSYVGYDDLLFEALDDKI